MLFLRDCLLTQLSYEKESLRIVRNAVNNPIDPNEIDEILEKVADMKELGPVATTSNQDSVQDFEDSMCDAVGFWEQTQEHNKIEIEETVANIENITLLLNLIATGDTPAVIAFLKKEIEDCRETQELSEAKMPPFLQERKDAIRSREKWKSLDYAQIDLLELILRVIEARL